MAQEENISLNPLDSHGRDVRKSLWDFLDSALTDWRRLLFLASLIAFLAIVLILAAYGILRVAVWNRLEIKQTESGGIIYRVGRQENLVFLLSASSPWISSDFFVRKGERLTIRASGQVCLAIHHLVKAAEFDSVPVQSWVGPEGMSDARKQKFFKPEDYWREKYLLVPGKPYGALIAAIRPNEHPPDSKDSIILVGKYWDSEAPSSGTLWFAVNDVILDSTRRDAYDVPAGHRSPGYSLPGPFENIVKKSYWNVWYDDNVGSFLITVLKGE